MKWYLLLLSAAFFGTLTAVVGGRAVAETHAFLIGILCGVGASVPASLVAAYLAQVPERSAVVAERPERPYAPVVMLSGRESIRAPVAPSLPLPVASESGVAPRPYRVVGEE